MVTSVDNDQRSSAPEAEAAPVPDQPAAPVLEAVSPPAVDSTVADVEPTAADRSAVVDPVGPADSAGPDASGPDPTDFDSGEDQGVATAALAARLEVAEDRAVAAETTIAALTQRLAELESRAGRAEGAARSLERGVAGADDQLESLTARVAELADVADRDRAGVAVLGTDIAALGTDVAAIGADVAELRETARRLDHDTAVAIAREVQRHTTVELVDGQQRLHQASVAMAGLAQALADAGRQVPSELTADSARTLLDSFVVDVDLLLQQLGHEALGVCVGDAFDAKRHRALRRVPTTDPGADRTVARVVRDGYRTPATDRVLLFADVEVYRAAGPKSAAEHRESSEKGN